MDKRKAGTTSGNILDKFRQYNWIARFLTPEALAQMKRYLITGFSSAAIEMLLLYLFKDKAHLSVVLANTIAYAVSFWFNFLMSRFWSFGSTGDIRRQLAIYTALFTFNLGASDAIMYLLTTYLSIQYLIAKVFAIGVIVSWNFVLYRKVIFK